MIKRNIIVKVQNKLYTFIYYENESSVLNLKNKIETCLDIKKEMFQLYYKEYLLKNNYNLNTLPLNSILRLKVYLETIHE